MADDKTPVNRHAPTPPSIATVEVTTPAVPQKPNNPFYLKAEALAAAKDWDGLEALDATLADAGYAPDGITRRYIDDQLKHAE